MLECASVCRYLSEEVFEGLKGRAVLRLVAPALEHQLVDVAGTVGRARQPCRVLVNLLQDLATIKIMCGHMEHWFFPWHRHQVEGNNCCLFQKTTNVGQLPLTCVPL